MVVDHINLVKIIPTPTRVLGSSFYEKIRFTSLNSFNHSKIQNLQLT